MAQPAPKRRRLTAPVDDVRVAVPVRFVHRIPESIRTSLQMLHRQIEDYADVTVCVQGEKGDSEEFPCVAALLAAASAPLRAMLFGPLRACTPHSGDGRPQLKLRETEPKHFSLLLRYAHGEDLPLEVDEAFQLHKVADFYEVLDLRDACTRFLLDSLTHHNCVHLLERAREVHCEELENRCIDLVALDFSGIKDHDPDFAALPASALQHTLMRDDLVAAAEYDVLDALSVWYLRQPSADKYDALLQLLPLVRWPLISPDKEADVNALALRLRPPRAPPTPPASAEEASSTSPLPSPSQGPQLQLQPEGKQPEGKQPPRSDTPLSQGAASETAESDNAGPAPSLASPPSSSRKRSHPADADASTQEDVDEGVASAEKDGPSEATTLVRELFDNRDEQELPNERQYMWGELQARDPPGATTLDGEKEHTLVATKEYMIGRSRKSDIRIGHNAPMPYISSQHCRVYHTIKWASTTGEAAAAGGQEASHGSSSSEAGAGGRLQAWLEDLSQNGTFINGTLLGKGKQQMLQDGDKIEMVFPSTRTPPQANAFPIFTYYRTRPQEPHENEGGAVVDVSQVSGEDEAEE